MVVTSKVLAIHQGRCVPMKDVADKDELIRQEAELYLDRRNLENGSIMLTIKNNLLIPTAGIDESNADGHYILWPQAPQREAEKLLEFIKHEYRIKKAGIIITDSHTIPLRWGTMGISLGHAGFCPLNDYRGSRDLFEREMKITLANVVDALAAAAVLVMGEGNEGTPLALVSEVPFVGFGKCPSQIPELEIDADTDIYGPLLKSVTWKKGH